MKVLVIDDDAGLRKSLGLILGEAGHQVVSAADGEEGLAAARNAEPDIILCDVRMPRLNGLEFLERYREEEGGALVVVMTAYGSRELAVEAMKAGAYDYIPKPFGADEVILTLVKAEEREELRREVGRLREEVRADARFGEIVARSPAMVRALEIAQRVAPHDSPVLISGNTGTGKELVARLIHRQSVRAGGPFVAVNCGAVPENLLESEFFGHVKGAFTGADRDREGLFEAARGGTLFLDEVGDLPLELQVKLLRVLQDGEVRRVGSTSSSSVDVRVVSATNRELERAVKEEEFRPDLYYRLAVVPISLPPLRERTEEIPDLVRHLLDRHRKRLGVDIDGVSPEAMEILLDYPWPGNIRELENVLERALVLTTSHQLQPADLPEHLRVPTPAGLDMELHGSDLSVKRRTADLERHLIEKALERTGGNRTQAAE
ncbi:MAG TPA: sigma-54 dependent transcriptional regulator, partial [Longimicrobiales bacterium]|nr:sigma-54 dependent transcriptional regulator [Longimicrobiales bacterium]